MGSAEVTGLAGVPPCTLGAFAIAGGFVLAWLTRPLLSGQTHPGPGHELPADTAGSEVPHRGRRLSHLSCASRNAGVGRRRAVCRKVRRARTRCGVQGLALAQPHRVLITQTGSLLWQTRLVLLPKASSDGLHPSLPWDRAGWLPASLPAAAGRLYRGRQRPAMCCAMPCRAVPCRAVPCRWAHAVLSPQAAAAMPRQPLPDAAQRPH